MTFQVMTHPPCGTQRAMRSQTLSAKSAHGSSRWRVLAALLCKEGWVEPPATVPTGWFLLTRSGKFVHCERRADPAGYISWTLRRSQRRGTLPPPSTGRAQTRAAAGMLRGGSGAIARFIVFSWQFLMKRVPSLAFIPYPEWVWKTARLRSVAKMRPFESSAHYQFPSDVSGTSSCTHFTQYQPSVVGWHFGLRGNNS